jgi:hypothetical protein
VTNDPEGLKKYRVKPKILRVNPKISGRMNMITLNNINSKTNNNILREKITITT